MKVYFDTNTISPNIEQDPTEQNALEELRQRAKKAELGIVEMSSNVALRETEKTRDEERRQELRKDYSRLTPVTKDERVLGSHSQSDQYGGLVSYPLVSDVQDEDILSELFKLGFDKNDDHDRHDAQHLTQAICNECDIFLTRDVKSIIKHRANIEAKFTSIKVMKPSELLQLVVTVYVKKSK